MKADVPIRSLAASGDGERALVWIDSKLQLLDLAQGRVLKTADPGLGAEGLAWTPDGKTVVLVGADPSQDGQGTVAFLDPSTLTTVSRSAGPHIAGGYMIQFAPDGRQFATSGSQRVGLWDARTRGYLGFVTAEEEAHAGFAPGTSDVLIASVDGEVSVWDPRPEAAVAAACRIASREMTEAEWSAYLPDRAKLDVCPT